MTQNSKVIPYAEMVNEEFSVNDISKRVIAFFQDLIMLNDAFNYIFVVSERKPHMDRIQINSDCAVDQLAEEILWQNREDIIKIDKVKNADVHYVRRDNYINFSLGVELKSEPFLTLSFSFIHSMHVKSKIGTLFATSKCFQNLEDCLLFIKLLNNNFQIEYACMKLSFFDREINKELRKYKAPLGLITYYSDQLYKNVPRNLPGVNYKLLDKGKILILKNSNLFDKGFEAKLSALTLLNLMRQIEKIYPAFSRIS